LTLTTLSPHRIVTFQSLGEWGRLGNQLFQIAATIGIARRNQCDFIFPPWSYANIFAHPLPQSKNPINGLEAFYEHAFHYQHINISGPTNLVGYFQSEKYFCHCAPDIRNFFTLKQDFLDQVEQSFAGFAEVKTCSVHVRRTDYMDNPNYIDLCATGYYENAIKQFDSDTKFIFFSDDIAWCKQRFSGQRFVFVEGLEDFMDLALMSRCTSNIIANSSFSWWGAWLNTNPDKSVVAPLAWFAGELADPSVPTRPGPPDLQGFCDTKDLIPQGWIRL
jgi:hypothetical protein